MPNTAMVFIPQNGTNVIQVGQAIPGTVIQSPGVIQYGGHQFGSPSNQHHQNSQAAPLEKLMKTDTKTLGAIQIIIGLIHIGFGAVQSVISLQSYLYLATVGGYPFWGGLFFIISGSLSVSSEKNPGVVKCSVGFNIVSAIMALVGVILYVTELAVNGSYQDQSYAKSVGTGLSVLLLLFTLLEFFITVSIAHFGCQTCCCKNEPDMVFVPYMVTGVGAIPAEGNPSPPSYDNIAFSPMRES